MLHSVKQTSLNTKSDRYNYRIMKDLRYNERAKAVLDYLNKQRCMPFKNGMGYSLTVEGSFLVLVTNRCACDCGEHKCLTREMKGDEYKMVCDVFDKSVNDAVKAVDRID